MKGMPFVSYKIQTDTTAAPALKKNLSDAIHKGGIHLFIKT